MVGKCDWCAKDIGGLRDIARTCSAACKQAMHRWRNDSLWIHPFERTDGGAAEWYGSDVATAEDYRWGSMAIALGRHMEDERATGEKDSRYSCWSEWYEEMVELESNLIAHAVDITGKRCMFNKGNNPNGLPRWD